MNEYSYIDGEPPLRLRGPIALTPIAAECATAECPTVYRSDRGTLVVQGYAVSAADAGIPLPEGELLVEIPASLLTLASDQLDRG